MQWSSRTKSLDERYPPYKPYRWWFAWYPVECHGRKIWLEWVPRRYVRRIVFMTPRYHAEYSYPEHSIAGNVLGEAEGRRHGPNKGYPIGSPIRTKLSHA